MSLEEKISSLVDDVSDWDAIVNDCNYSEGDKSEHLYNKIFDITSKHLQGMFGGPIELEVAVYAILEKIFVAYSCSMNGSFLSDVEKNIAMEIIHAHGEEIKNFKPTNY